MWACWLRERLRDVTRWPINLGRDFPDRWRRLLEAVRQAPVGGRPEPAIPAPVGNVHPGLFWLHRLLVALFDLGGGPEICEFCLRFITHTTPLTVGEKAALATVLGPDGLRFADTRVAQGGLLAKVFNYNGHLAFTAWHTVCLPETEKIEQSRRARDNVALLVHELTHVYQYEVVGTRYMSEAIAVLVRSQRDCYNYDGDSGLASAQGEGKQLHHFNREQQAQIAQDYFVLQQAGKDTSSYHFYIEQLRRRAL